MKKKKNKLTSLIIACAVLVAVLVVFLVVQNRAKAYNDAQSAASTDATLFDGLTVDKIKSISYTVSGSEELTCTRVDEADASSSSSTSEAASEATSDSTSTDATTWVCDQYPAETLDSTKVGALASSITGVTVTQQIDSVTDLSQYGLDEPSITGSYTDTDGKTTSFTIGNTNTAASVVYLYLGDDTSTVYAVSTSISDYLTKGISDYLPDSSSTAATSEVTSTAS